MRTSTFADRKIREMLELSRGTDLNEEQITRIKEFSRIVGDDIIKFTLDKRIKND